MRVLFIGDIVGKPGRQMVASLLPALVAEHEVSIVLANGENAAAGFGITPGIAEELFALGIDLLTSGNHVWDKKEIEEYLAKQHRLLRPANYPPGAPGRGAYILERGGARLAILNLQGRVFMPTTDCPFQVGDQQITLLRQSTNAILVDFHAEATSEKQAFAWHAAGRVSAVIGSHTHVQTADERILPGGTAYITDAGMTGGRDSVIGMERQESIERFLLQVPRKFNPAAGIPQFDGVVVEIDDVSGHARSITRLHREGRP